MPNLNFDEVKKWIDKLIVQYKKKTGDINYIFCSDNYLLEINKQYLNHDFYTDIVTFDYCEGEMISGDIFISLDRVAENAKLYDSQKTELYRVMIHGVLHLIGLEDHSDEEKNLMRKAEDEALNLL